MTPRSTPGGGALGPQSLAGSTVRPRPAPGAKRQVSGTEGKWAAFSRVAQLHRSVCPLSLQLAEVGNSSLIPAPHIAFDARSRISDWATDGYVRPFCCGKKGCGDRREAQMEKKEVCGAGGRGISREKGRRDEHSPPTKIPPPLQAASSGPPLPHPPFPNANTHAGKLQVPESSQVVLGPESCLFRNSPSACLAPEPPDQRGSDPSDAEGASVGPASLGRRDRGAREPTSALWAHPWASTSRVSQPGGLAGEPQVGSAGARRPLEAVLSKADARPFLLPSIPSTWASASLIALLRSL